jgi:hypothetical protein
MRTLFSHVISTSGVMNYATYVSYVIHASYNGHSYDIYAYVFCDICHGGFVTYGSEVIYPMRTLYMESTYKCHWLVMLSLRILQLLGLHNEVIMEYIGLEY